MTVTEKTCKECHQVKPEGDFKPHKVKEGRVYFRNRCRTCYNEIRKADPNYRKNRRDRDLRSKYGIDLKTYQNMKSTQNDLCAICELPEERKELNVDHCHSSGKVRQLLCSRCNLILGQVGDNISLLEKYILYLNTHKETEE